MSASFSDEDEQPPFLVRPDDPMLLAPPADDKDEQRVWFYAHCMPLKLACAHEDLRRMLIAELYDELLCEQVPPEEWLSWLRERLALNGKDEPRRYSAMPKCADAICDEPYGDGKRGFTTLPPRRTPPSPPRDLGFGL
eukprot:TRINITY_DN18552_c0_g1_i1.p1 TRINITY_DN18552_c0_g1~~TRINITY_DN18552_c0_g1_i1.p1  ORF type:complete len:162 (+),score=32.47 TRINITY_DN18552_c0_g1_i1:75-488(+)